MKKPFNRAIRILLATNGMILLSTSMLGPIYALFVGEVGGDLLSASYAAGIFALSAGITSIISGKYVDKVKEKEMVVVLGYSIIAIGFLGYTAVDSMMTLLLVQVVIGIGDALYVPAFDTVYTEHLDKNKLGAGWGTWEAMYYFTYAIGAFLGGILVAAFGFDVLFISMSVLSAASAIYIAQLPRDVI